MARSLSPEELDWAHECAAAGDSFAEIGAELGVSAAVVGEALGLRPMTERQSAIAELWAAGSTQAAIADEVGPPTSRKSVAVMLESLRRRGYRVRLGERGRARDADIRASIREALRLGTSTRETARAFDVSRSVVDHIRAELGLVRPGRQPGRAPFCPRRNAAIVKAVEGGSSFRQVAAKHGVTPGVVSGAVFRARQQVREPQHG